jgi:hypothetical protein
MLKRIWDGNFRSTVDFGHSSVSNYQRISAIHPLPWFVYNYGSISIGERNVRLGAALARSSARAFARIPQWDLLVKGFEIAECGNVSSRASHQEIQKMWCELISEWATPSALLDDSLHDLWVAAAEDGVFPVSFATEGGIVPLSQVYVTTSSDLARRVRTPKRVVITLDEHTCRVWQERGAQSLADFAYLEGCVRSDDDPRWRRSGTPRSASGASEADSQMPACHRT